jgi:hypothetical protein
MQLALIIATSLHVLSAVFWAGTTFAIVRMGGGGAERLFRPQMIAAAIAILTGGYLWRQLHEGSLGPMEQFLGTGAVAAVVAVIVQALLVGLAIRKLDRGDGGDATARSAVLTANRIAAILLAVATIAMAGARYA